VADASRIDEGKERPKVALVGLGCRVNRSDLDSLADELADPFVLVGDGERPDYVVVNTCTVTADADATARQAIRRAARKNPGARILVAGCYAEVRPDELRSLPNVVAVVGARSRHLVAETLQQLHERWLGEARTAIPSGLITAAEGPAPDRRCGSAGELGLHAVLPNGHTRALLKIQDGCDACCAYCVVPRARGRSRSLRLDEALERIAGLGQRSREVVLSGVHIGAYGADLSPPASLSELVCAASSRGLAHRLRLSSIEPGELPIELFDGPARGRLCEHVHLPLQSGSARVLAAMRRPYTPSAYAAIVERFAKAVPRACIGADVLAGFPGETDEDHRATLALAESLPFAYLHVFVFSPRPGTAAAGMAGQVSPKLARARARELSAFSARRWRGFVSAQRGRELEVVVERVSGGMAIGTAREYVAVRWSAGRERRGDLARVRVEAVDGEECLGVGAAEAASRP